MEDVLQRLQQLRWRDLRWNLYIRFRAANPLPNPEREPAVTLSDHLHTKATVYVVAHRSIIIPRRGLTADPPQALIPASPKHRQTVMSPSAPDLHRLRNIPTPPLPPEDLRGGVGPGDFWGHGWDTAEQLARFLDAGQCRRVLEVGSGLGRIAFPLSHLLGEEATYTGLDVAPAYVAWCRETFRDDRRFRFEHLDVFSSQYNPDARRKAHRARFPVETGDFDLVLATSLFTHLVPREAKRYAREVARALRPGGMFFCTLLLEDSGSRPRIEAFDTYPVFRYRIRHARLVDTSSPADGVALDRAWFERQLERSGLELMSVDEGGWRGTDAYYQDVLVARKAA